MNRERGLILLSVLALIVCGCRDPSVPKGTDDTSSGSSTATASTSATSTSVPDLATGSTDASSTGSTAICGDGIVSGDELCDGGALAGQPCPESCRFAPGETLWEVEVDYEGVTDGPRAVKCSADNQATIGGEAGREAGGTYAAFLIIGDDGDVEVKAAVSPAPEGSGSFNAVALAGNGAVAAGQRDNEAWVVRLSATGEVVWEDVFVGEPSGTEFFGNAAHVLEDGRFEFAVGIGLADSTVVGYLLRYSPAGERTATIELEAPPDPDTMVSWLASLDVTPAPDAGYILSGGISLGSGFDAYVARRDADHQTLWDAFLDSPEDPDLDVAHPVAIDGAGSVFVGMGYRPVGELDDIRVVKYSPEGDELWHIDHAGQYGRSDIPTGLAVNESGAVFVHGRIANDDAPQPFDDYDMWLARYSADGELEWESEWDGGGAGDGTYSWDDAGPIAVCPDGTLSVTGSTYRVETGSDVLVRRLAP